MKLFVILMTAERHAGFRAWLRSLLLGGPFRFRRFHLLRVRAADAAEAESRADKWVRALMPPKDGWQCHYVQAIRMTGDLSESGDEVIDFCVKVQVGDRRGRRIHPENHPDGIRRVILP